MGRGAPGSGKMWIVMTHEFMSTVSKRSFWLTTFAFPLLILLMSVGAQLFALDMTAGISGDLPTGEQPFEGAAAGYVDANGLVTLPPNLPAGALLPFTTEAEAGRALAEDRIGSYYVIPPGFVSTGTLILVESNPSILAAETVNPFMRYALAFSLTGSTGTARLLVDPLFNVADMPQTPAADGRPAGALSFLVPYATMMIFYFVLVMSSGFMLQSVAKEKENRTAELLLLSIRPRTLLMGKVLGLSAIAFLQMAIWLGAGVLILQNSTGLLGLEQAFTLPSSFFAWGLAYFLLGYFAYASIYAAIGVMAPSAREANQFVFVALVPLIVPLFFISAFVEAPGGSLVRFLSMFPLTSPVSMITRLASGPVPFWELLLGLGLLALAAYGFVLLGARFFRADTLLSTKPLTWDRLVSEVIRRRGSSRAGA